MSSQKYGITTALYVRLPFFAVILLILLCVCCSGASATEAIENYDVKIRINRDSSIEVTEDITARVENIAIRRGIIRTFPVEYRDSDGKTAEVSFDVADVRLDGAAVAWRAERAGRNIDLRIGDPDRILAPGLHTFTIKYITTGQIGFFEDHDELYWNVTGNDWVFPIMRASCSAALPDRPFGKGFRDVEWYVGEYGAKGARGDAVLTSANSVVTTRALAPKEGLTVVFAWPKGLVTPPPPKPRDNEKAQTAIGALTLLLVSGWFLYAWRKWGRDPVRKAVIPVFYPPEGSSPAFLRYVRDMRVDHTALASAILGLAVKGALTIEEKEDIKTFFETKKGGYVLHKAADAADDSALEQEEKALMMQLFSGSIESVEINQSCSTRIASAMSSLKRNLRRRGEGLFLRNTDKVMAGALIYALGIAALYPFSGVHTINLMLSGVCGFILISLGMRLKRAANSGIQNATQFLKRVLPSAFLASLGSVALIDEGYSPLTFIMFMAAAAVISVMRPLMVARTKEGSDLLSDIEGLRLYMVTAEKDRLEMFNPPDETPELFERLLPYALALDAAKTWGNRFEKVLAAVGYRPRWYAGPAPYIFIRGSGLNDFSSGFVDSLGQSMSPPAPGRSSGLGGGGFSGGGGGGGGGKGW